MPHCACLERTDVASQAETYMLQSQSKHTLTAATVVRCQVQAYDERHRVCHNAGL